MLVGELERKDTFKIQSERIKLANLVYVHLSLYGLQERVVVNFVIKLHLSKGIFLMVLFIPIYFLVLSSILFTLQ